MIVQNMIDKLLQEDPKANLFIECERFFSAPISVEESLIGVTKGVVIKIKD